MELDDPRIRTAQQSHHSAVRGLYKGVEPAHVLSIAGGLAYTEYLHPTDISFGSWFKANVSALKENAEHAADGTTFRPVVLEFTPFGLHFMDAIMGARVYEENGNFWAEELKADPADLAPVDAVHHPLFKWTVEQIRYMLANLPETVIVTYPAFSAPLVVGVSIFGERLLAGLGAGDAGTVHAMERIADAIRALNAYMRDNFDAKRVRFYGSSSRFTPEGYSHIYGCTTHLVSAATYEKYVAPLDDAVLRSFPEGGTMHVCGDHGRHIPCWKKMESLRAVQLNDAASDDFELYFKGLRDDQAIYVSPTEYMTVGRIIAISRGRRLIVQSKLETRIPTG